MTISDLDFTSMDETQLSALADAALTEVRTRAAIQPAELAWSKAEPADINTYQPAPRRHWLTALVATLSVIVGWLGITLLHEHATSTAVPPSVDVAAPETVMIQAPAQTPPPVTAPVPTIAEPTPPPAPETQDEKFLRLMAQSGWNMTEATPTTLIHAAKTICRRGTLGQSRTGMLKDLKDGTPDITNQHANALINNAETTYCPTTTT